MKPSQTAGSFLQGRFHEESETIFDNLLWDARKK
jgi:hypothetical protein